VEEPGEGILAAVELLFGGGQPGIVLLLRRGGRDMFLDCLPAALLRVEFRQEELPAVRHHRVKRSVAGIRQDRRRVRFSRIDGMREFQPRTLIGAFSLLKWSQQLDLEIGIE